MTHCSISGLRQNIYKVCAEVEKGKQVTIVRSGKAVAILIPFSENSASSEEEFDPEFLKEIRSRAKSPRSDFLSFGDFDQLMMKQS
jgi:prevent-host-death family protein